MSQVSPLPSFQTHLQFKVRESKRSRIEKMFSENLGTRYETMFLHEMFGSAFRSRVSEINRDLKCSIAIKNRTWSDGTREHSEYWAEARNA